MRTSKPPVTMSCHTPIPITPSPPPPSPTPSTSSRSPFSTKPRRFIANPSAQHEPPTSRRRQHRSPNRARIVRRSQGLFGHSRSRSLPAVRTEDFIMTEPARQPDPALLVSSGLTAPSEEEAQLYYIGLPSEPRLIARTSTEPWVRRSNRGWTLYKSLEPVGKHSIVMLWNQSLGSLRRRILQAISMLQWTAVDILRLRYEPVTNNQDVPLDNPVTMLVSVEPGSTSWSLGVSAALECRFILQQYLASLPPYSRLSIISRVPPK